MTGLFDTHAHLIADDPVRYPANAMRGYPDLPAIPPALTGEMLLAKMDAENVAQACLVQRAHVYGYDNSYVIDCARAAPDRLLSVGVFDAQDPATPATVEDLVRNRQLGGARLCQVRPWELDTAWFNSPQAIRFWDTANALRLPVTLIFFQYHLRWTLPALHAIALLYPDLSIIIDHVGTGHGSKPELLWGAEQGRDVSAPGAPDYGVRDYLEPFLTVPNVAFKMTQINVDILRAGTISLAAYVRRITDLFGPDRLIWGSDIGQSGGSYADMAAAAREAGSLLDDADRQRFFFGNAHRIYRER